MNKTEKKREREKKTVSEMIRKVMRYSGPRMIFHHPVMALRHVIENKREKRRLEKENEY